LGFAKLKDDLYQAVRTNPAMNANWIIAKNWAETSRYQKKTAADAVGLLKAIEDQSGGLLPWVQKRW
jgi:hypothetical protein